MNENSVTTIIKNVDYKLCELIKHVICSICHELLKKPVTTPCGHSFCFGCIRRALSSKDNSGCPLCKNPVERYSLLNDNAKLTFSKICHELPHAFLEDVTDLQNYLSESTEDLIKTLNLCHFFTQDSSKKIKSNKKRPFISHIKSGSNMKIKNSDYIETGTYVQILNQNTNMTEHRNTKKKRLGDLMSMGQTTDVSHSTSDESLGLGKKLNEIEKVPAHVNMKEWFKTVEDRISLNLPKLNPSVINENLRSTTEGIINKNNNKKPSSMIRIDYQKSVESKSSEKKPTNMADPYEFIPSQNKFSTKKRKKLIAKKKKISDIQSIQSFIKENTKRNYLLSKCKKKKETSTEPISLASCSELCREIKKENWKEVITASQKFDKLLLEINEDEKIKGNKVNSELNATQLSGAQYSDFSSSAEVSPENLKNQMTSELSKKKKASPVYLGEEETTFGLFSSSAEDESSRNFKQKSRKRIRQSCVKKKRSLTTHTNSEIKKTFSDIVNMKSQDAFELEKSMEKYLKNFELNKKLNFFSKNTKENSNNKLSYNDLFCKPTKLMSLLYELVNDNYLHANHSKNISRVLPKEKMEINKEFNQINKNSEDLSKELKNENIYKFVNNFSKCDSSEVSFLRNLKEKEEMTLKTDLVGFGTEEELPEKNILKDIIENIEKELNSTDVKQEFQNKNECYSEISDSLEISSGSDQDLKQSTNLKDKECTGKSDYYCSDKFVNTSLVSFTLMGKIKKHKHSFINFLQLGRLTPTIKRTRSSVVKLVFPIGLASFTKKQQIQKKCAVGVQTPLALIRTNRNSFSKPISYGEKKASKMSVEIQTSQKTVSSASIQTSEIQASSTTIQTSQQVKASVEIQTAMKHVVNAGIQTSQNENDDIEKNLKQKSKNSNGIQSPEIPLGIEVQTFGTSSCIENKSAHNIPPKIRNTVLSINDILNNSDKTAGVEYFENRIQSTKSFEIKNLPKYQSRNTQNFAPLLCNNQVTQKKTANDEFLKSDPDLLPTNLPCFHEHLEEGNQKAISTSLFCSIRTLEAERHCDNSSARSKYVNNTSKYVNPKDVIEKDETSQLIPSQVKDISQNREVEIVNLKPEENNEDSELQLLRVLKNIDLDLTKTKKNNNNHKELQNKVENSEESDSDVFVEQTPPRPEYSLIDESRHLKQKTVSNAENKVLQKTNEDIARASIEDSKPITFRESESFLVLSAPQGGILTLKESQKNFENSDENILIESQMEKISEKKPQVLFKRESISDIVNPFQLFKKKTNENDQNQLNASDENRIKTTNAEVKSIPYKAADARKRFSEKPRKKLDNQEKKKFCIVASSVKNLDMIRKFTMEFQMEYLSKPTTEMTHLIVGLHENDEGEILPLCTPKLLFAMANKKWIVSELWAETCLKSKTILPEDNFETCDPIGGSGCRNSRLSTDRLLKNCEICLFGNFQNILKEELADLILHSGGTIISSPEKFSFSAQKIRMIVADKDCLNLNSDELREMHEKFCTVILSRDIIIMSIQSHILSNFTPYLLHLANFEDLLNMGYPADLVKQEDCN